MAPTAMEPTIEDPRRQLLDTIKANPIHIPNLTPIFAGWPVSVNPHWKELVPVMEARIDDLIPDQTKATKLKTCDFALFASAWWPRADFAELRILAYLAFWLFIWDDEIDETTGSLSNNFDAAQQYRRDTIEFVSQSLRLDDGDDRDGHSRRAFCPTNAIIRSFGVIGDAISEAYNREQCETLFDEICYFMDMSQLEQEYKLEGHMPTLDEYWRVRMGTSAVGVIMAVNEFSAKTTIPRSLINHPEMKALWNEANINVSITNDLLSLKKEIAKDVVDSLIPVLCASLKKNPQVVVSVAVRSLKESLNRFDEAANRFLASIDDDDDDDDHDDDNASSSLVKMDVQEFIDDCRYNCTGNLYWSLRTARYGLQNIPRDRNGGITITF